ncbi:lipocalin-like domain-containing protein [Segatella paludivivens]|uniref:lipocalin-like domain-containing protein n=1 Tax=Segatella paludivivens TaxID=185294 RepID=UPI00036654EF|nr:lipocalin-like domain-containing protein [Segatella paludivivens]
MKRNIIYILSVALSLLVFQSCELETSDNGNLDGNWQLIQIDTLATGGRNDVKEYQLFYAVQVRLLCLKAYNDNISSDMYFHFEHTADSLKLKPASSDGHVMYPVSALRPYGINKEQEAFKIMLLNSDRMQLRSDSLLLTFRKF